MLDSIQLLRRQYLQTLDPTLLRLPRKADLRSVETQQRIHATMFDETRVKFLPPKRYQYRVLKRLMLEIENAIVDSDEDEILEELSAYFASLMSRSLPSEVAAAQRKGFVTYIAPLPASECFSVSLLEAPSLLASSGDTGLRTWEASLHLGSFLCTSDGRQQIHGKNVLELGAGTGFVSILCAKYLQAKRVMATDGSLAVINDLQSNVNLNALELEQILEVRQLKWGHSLLGGPTDARSGGHNFDLAIGADITYDLKILPALVATLRDLFELSPSMQVFISATVRNEDTIACFLEACARNAFNVQEVEFQKLPFLEQEGFFVPDASNIKIFNITGSGATQDAFHT